MNVYIVLIEVFFLSSHDKTKAIESFNQFFWFGIVIWAYGIVVKENQSYLPLAELCIVETDGFKAQLKETLIALHQ